MKKTSILVKYLSTEELQRLNPETVANDYGWSQINLQIEQTEQLKEFYDAYIVHIFRNDSGQFFYEMSTIYLMHPNEKTFKIRASFGEVNKNKWHFSIDPDDVRKLNNLSYNDKDVVRRTFEQPNKIGKLSVPKIEEWISFLTDNYNALVEKNGENSTIVEAFRDKIKDLPVQWFHGGTNERGYIDGENGLRYSFSIEKNYVGESIEYKGKQTLDTFLELTK